MRIVENKSETDRRALEVELAGLTSFQDVTEGLEYHGDDGFETAAREAANRDRSKDPAWYGFTK